ncbi:MAG: energy transducer TonB [Gammaproteobacteria bacterium]|nr:MAG: energy transducer TonB [Gammaproteobacteria bacterium]
MFARLSISLVAGTVATFALLWIMQILIATGQKAIQDTKDFKFVDFVRVERQETLETKKPKPKKPPEPDKPPPDMPPPDLDNIDPNAGSINIAPVNVNANVSIGGIGGFDNVDGEYLPIVKVAPIYPRRAQARGLSGYCILTFTVTKLGTVTDVKVDECSSSLFERASVNAALKFKYKPRVVNGEPIDVPGVKHRISFEIED